MRKTAKKLLASCLTLLMILSSNSSVLNIVAEQDSSEFTAEVTEETEPPVSEEVPPAEETPSAEGVTDPGEKPEPAETPSANPASAEETQDQKKEDENEEAEDGFVEDPEKEPEEEGETAEPEEENSEENESFSEDEKESETDEEESVFTVYRAESISEFTAAVSELNDDADRRLLVSTGQDLKDILRKGKAVYFNRSYIIEFKNSEDRDEAYDLVKAALLEGGTVTRDAAMGLCEDDSDTDARNTELMDQQSEESSEQFQPEQQSVNETDSAGEDIGQESDDTGMNNPNDSSEPENEAGNSEEKPAEEYDEFDYEITVDPEAVSLAEEGLAISSDAEKTVKVIALIDSGVSGDLADAKVNLTEDSDDDVNGHGTAMADIIKKLAGDKASIISVKAFNDNGTGSIANVTAAIKYAIEADVDIISISAAIRESEKTELLEEAVNEALRNGIVVVAAAGNNSTDAAGFIPANIDGVDTIGAAYAESNSLSCFTAMPFSNYGPSVDYWYIADSTSEAAAQETGVLAAGIENDGWMTTNRWYRFPVVKFRNGGSNDGNYNPFNNGNYSPYTWVPEDELILAYTVTGSGNLVTDRDPTSWDGFAYRGSTFRIDGQSVSCIDPDRYANNNATYTESVSCSVSSSTQRYWYDDSKYRGNVNYYTVDLRPVPADPNRYSPLKDTFVYENRGTADLSSDGYYVRVSVDNGDKSAVNARISGNSLLVDIDENVADMPDGITVTVQTDKEIIGYTDWITYYETCSSTWEAGPNDQRMSGGSSSNSWEEEGGSTDTYLYEDDSVTLNVLRGGIDLSKFDSDRMATQHIPDPNRAQGDATLAGTEFTIYNSRNSAAVAVIVTDSRGKPASVKNNIKGTGDRLNGDFLKWGDYLVKETKAPEGYLLNDEWSFYFEVREDKHIYNASFESDGAEGTNGGDVIDPPIRGGLNVTKFDTERHAGHAPDGTANPDGDVKHNTPQGNASLEGAEFQIINRSIDEVYVEGVWYQPGQTVKTLVTDRDGFASTEDDTLPYGTYQIVETKAPNGYILNSGWQVTIKVTEHKRIYRTTDIAGQPYVKSSSEDGSKTEHDYVYDHHSNGVISSDFMMNDVIRGGVKFQKVDRERYEIQGERPGNRPQGDTTLEGTVISIYNRSDYSVMVYGQWYQPGDCVYKLVTDAKGACATAADALPYGDYYAKETQAPVGYLIDTNWEYEFTVSEDGVIIDGTGKVIKETPIRGDVQVYKYDEELNRSETMDGKDHSSRLTNLSNIAFEIYNEGLEEVLIPDDESSRYRAVGVGELVDTIYTQWDSTTGMYVAKTINHELPYGSYSIKEVPCSISKTNTIKMTDRELETSVNDAYLLTDGTKRYFQIGDHSYGPVTLDTDVESVYGLVTDFGSNENTKNYRTDFTERARTLLTYTTYDAASGRAVTSHVSYWSMNGNSTDSVSNPMSDLQEKDGTMIRKTGTEELDKTLIFKNRVKRNELKFDKKRFGDNKPLETLWVLRNVTSGERHMLYANTDGECRTTLYPHEKDTNINDKFLAMYDQGIEISLGHGATNEYTDEEGNVISVGDVVTDYGVWFGTGEDGTESTVDNALAALPYGDYSLDEVRCTSNSGLRLQHVDIKVDKDITIYTSGYDTGTITDYGISMTSELLNGETQDHSGIADGSVIKLTDKVTYYVSDLKEEMPAVTEYVLEGKLKNKATGEFLRDSEGNEITAIQSVIIDTGVPGWKSGKVEQEFEIDTTDLGGTDIVAYEYLWPRDEWERRNS